jgi:hypothetical protein
LQVTRDEDRDDQSVLEAITSRHVVTSSASTLAGLWLKKADGVDRALTMAIIPAIMTGTTHFIIRSGLRIDMAEIPTPDLAVP